MIKALGFNKVQQYIFMIAARWFIFATLLICACGVAPISVPGNYTTQVPSMTLGPKPFSGGPGINTVQVQFSINSPSLICSALMVVKKSSSLPSFTNFDFTNLSPTQSSSYDLQNANIGAPQTVQLSNLNTAGDTYYIFIFNFDYNVPKYFAYTLTITEQSGITSNCPAPNYNNLPYTIYCSSCVNSGYGAYCSLYDTFLSNGNTLSILMSGNSYNHVTIPSSNQQLTTTYSTGGNNMQLFVQFQDNSTNIAGYFNYAESSSGVGVFDVNQPNYQYTLQINSGGSSISIGIKNKDTQPHIFTIKFTAPTTSNVLAIVLGVLGGLLFIALIVAAFFIIRRVRNSEQQIHPRAAASIIAQQNALSSQQIQTFFPSVLCRAIFPEEEMSMSQLHPQQKTSQDRDCVICLCPVGMDDMMKMTYCKHVFHGTCLGEWFKKQRNCPYCRESYNRTQTMDHYQAVLKNSGRNFLAGTELVQQILRTRPAKSRIVIEDIKD